MSASSCDNILMRILELEPAEQTQLLVTLAENFRVRALPNEVSTESYLEVLRHEFSAADGSFLIQLRCDFIWDRDAFSRLIRAMQLCCEQHAKYEALDRWLADGFWYLSFFVKGHSSHPNFQRPHPEEYYAAAYQRLWDLAEWFFTGQRPYLPGSGFEPL